MRTKGSTNKPKTINVSLEKLNSMFRPETLIEVSIKYADILNLKETDIELVERPMIKNESKTSSEAPAVPVALIMPKPKL